MSQLTELIEREVEKQAGLPVFVEEDGRRLVVTGMASSEEEKQAALDIARSEPGCAACPELLTHAMRS